MVPYYEIDIPTGAEWWDRIGRVPLDRVLMEPAPGMATEQQVVHLVDSKTWLGELVAGTLITRVPGFWEAAVGARLVSHVLGYGEHRRNGVAVGVRAMMRMQSGNVRATPVAYWNRDQFPQGKIPFTDPMGIAPLLAAEFVYSDNTELEIEQKIADYLSSGTKLFWLLNADAETVAVYERIGSPSKMLKSPDVLDGGDILEGFKYSLDELFSELP